MSFKSINYLQDKKKDIDFFGDLRAKSKQSMIAESGRECENV